MLQLIQLDTRTTNLNALVETIAQMFGESQDVTAALEACDLQPLTATINHAALAAVTVLLAADGPKAPAAPPADSTAPGALPTHKPAIKAPKKPNSLQCPSCLLDFKSPKRLQNHIAAKHPGIADGAE